MSGRKPNGRFAVGNPGGPGRSRRAVEADYLAVLSEVCPLAEWREVVARAVADAKGGDPRAREWIARHLLGDSASLKALAIAEHNGTVDDDLAREAAKIAESNRLMELLVNASPYRNG